MKRRDVILGLFAVLVFTPGFFSRIEKARFVALIKLDGIVHPITAEYVIESLHECDKPEPPICAAAILEINTPGGLDSSMREIISAILASRTPVFGWVGPSGSRAASAGFLILLSTDVASMALGTNTGAAHPVFMSGQEMTETMKHKVENDSTAYLRSFTAPRNRNPEIAEKGIIDSRSFSETEALNNHLIDLIASSPEDLLRQLDQREFKRFGGQSVSFHLAGTEIVNFEPTTRQSFLSSVIEPNIALILMAVGALGLFVEFNHPGLIFPGVAGAIALLLGLFAITLLPVTLTGALLIVLAFTLFVLEAKVMSHGILAVGGIISLVLGSLILIDSPIPELRVRLTTAVAIALPMALITVFLLRLAIKARSAKVVTGAAGLLDEVGTAMEDFVADGTEFGGQILIDGEIWRALAKQPVERGARLRVRAVEKLRLHVEPTTPTIPTIPAPAAKV